MRVLVTHQCWPVLIPRPGNWHHVNWWFSPCSKRFFFGFSGFSHLLENLNSNLIWNLSYKGLPVIKLFGATLITQLSLLTRNLKTLNCSLLVYIIRLNLINAVLSCVSHILRYNSLLCVVLRRWELGDSTRHVIAF